MEFNLHYVSFVLECFGCVHHGIPPGFITPDDFCALHSALAVYIEDVRNRMSFHTEQRGRVR